MRRVLILLLLPVALAANAGTGQIADFDRPVKMLLCHLRLERHPNRNNPAVLYWNYTDSLNHLRAEFDIPQKEDQADFASPVHLTVARRCGGRDSMVLDQKIFVKGYDGFSAILSVHPGRRASLALGGDKAAEAFAVPFDSERPGKMLYDTALPAAELNNLVLVQHRDGARFIDQPVDELVRDIAAGSDRMAALWTYLDRNSDPAQSAISRRYVLATVPDGSGDYDIVYIDGDTPGWKPGQIKGRLIKTVFTDHYDLEWTTADGTTLCDDTSATVEGASNILRLDFPLLKSSVRFRRAR